MMVASINDKTSHDGDIASHMATNSPVMRIFGGRPILPLCSKARCSPAVAQDVDDVSKLDVDGAAAFCSNVEIHLRNIVT